MTICLSNSCCSVDNMIILYHIFTLSNTLVQTAQNQSRVIKAYNLNVARVTESWLCSFCFVGIFLMYGKSQLAVFSWKNDGDIVMWYVHNATEGLRVNNYIMLQYSFCTKHSSIILIQNFNADEFDIKPKWCILQVLWCIFDTSLHNFVLH